MLPAQEGKLVITRYELEGGSVEVGVEGLEVEQLEEGSEAEGSRT